MTEPGVAPERRDAVGGIAALFSVLSYGLIPCGVALAVRAGVTLPQLFFGRTVLALGVLGGLVAARRLWRRGATSRPSPWRSYARLFVLGATCYCGQMVLYFGAVTRIDVSVAAVLAYIYPVLVALGGVVLGLDRLGIRPVAALLLSALGVVLVVGDGAQSGTDVLGVAMAVGSALAYATYILFTARIIGTVGPLVSSCWVLAGTACTSAVLLIVLPQPPVQLAPVALWLSLHGLLLLPVAVVAFMVAVTRLGPVRASIVDTVQPLVTAVAGVLLLGDRVSPLRVAGGACVLGAAALALRARRPATEISIPREGVQR